MVSAQVVLVALSAWTRPRDAWRLADQEDLLAAHVRFLARAGGDGTFGAGLDAALVGRFARAFFEDALERPARSAEAVPFTPDAARVLNAAELAALDGDAHVALLVHTSGACAGNALCAALLEGWDGLARDYAETLGTAAVIATLDVDANDAPRTLNLDALPAVAYLAPGRHAAPVQIPPRATAPAAFRANFDRLLAALAARADAPPAGEDEL